MGHDWDATNAMKDKIERKAKARGIECRNQVPLKTKELRGCAEVIANNLIGVSSSRFRGIRERRLIEDTCIEMRIFISKITERITSTLEAIDAFDVEDDIRIEADAIIAAENKAKREAE